MKFEGEYLYNQKRRGTEYYKKGNISYEGEYLFSKKWTGKGYDNEGNIIYELNEENGEIKNFYDNGQLSLEGKLVKGEIKGILKEYDENGHLKFEGEYKNEEKWNEILKDYSKGNLLFEAEIKEGKIIKLNFMIRIIYWNLKMELDILENIMILKFLKVLKL